MAELEAKLAAPGKTPDNSSMPPSKGQKANLPDRAKKPRGGRAGVARALAEQPGQAHRGDTGWLSALRPRVWSRRPGRHPRLRSHRPAAAQPRCHPHHRHRGVCPCCHKRIAAPAPEGFDPGSPFGPGLSALIIHLHITQAISFQRLVRLMAEVFGVTLSEGAIANILARAQAPLVVAAQPLAQAVRTSLVVGCDETSARVGGKTWWQWVLLSFTGFHALQPDTLVTL
jgi:transposase